MPNVSLNDLLDYTDWQREHWSAIIEQPPVRSQSTLRPTAMGVSSR